MKKLYIVFTVALMVLAIASCKKDNIHDGSKDDLNTQSNNKVTSMLLDFKQTLNHKSTGTLIADSAEWYLEGLLNLEQANNSHEFETVDFYHDTLVINVTGNQVNLGDIDNMYSVISDWSESIKQAKDSDLYAFDIIDLSFEDSALKNGEKYVVVALSGGMSGSSSNYVPFGTTDYWYWGYGLGKCGEFTGQCIGRDAATELQFKFSHPTAVEPTGYFVSVVSVLAMSNSFPDPNSPNGSNMTFYASGINPFPIEEPCLPPDDLNYYLNQFDYIKSTFSFPGKTYQRAEVLESWGTAIGTWEVMHDYLLYFGKKIENPN